MLPPLIYTIFAGLIRPSRVHKADFAWTVSIYDSSWQLVIEATWSSILLQSCKGIIHRLKLLVYVARNLTCSVLLPRTLVPQMIYRLSMNCNAIDPLDSRCWSFIQFRLSTDWIIQRYIWVTLLVSIIQEIRSNLLVSRWWSHFGIFRSCWVLIAPKTFSIFCLSDLTVVPLFLYIICRQRHMVAVIKLMGSKNGAREIMVVQNPWSYRLTGSINDIASSVTWLEMQGSNAPRG